MLNKVAFSKFEVAAEDPKVIIGGIEPGSLTLLMY